LNTRDGSTPYRLFLADDHILVREGLRRLINETVDLHVVAEASDGISALEKIAAMELDLLILDVIMPGMTGLQVAHEVSRRGIKAQILFLSAAANEKYMCEALRLGAAGYVHKSMTSTEFLDACRRAIHGEPALYPAAITALIRSYLAQQDADLDAIPGSILTSREEQIVKLIAEGYSGPEIAEILFISPRTVERHRNNLLQKLQLKDRVGLTRFAIRTGLIEA